MKLNFERLADLKMTPEMHFSMTERATTPVLLLTLAISISISNKGAHFSWALVCYSVVNSKYVQIYVSMLNLEKF